MNIVFRRTTNLSATTSGLLPLNKVCKMIQRQRVKTLGRRMLSVNIIGFVVNKIIAAGAQV